MPQPDLTPASPSPLKDWAHRYLQQDRLAAADRRRYLEPFLADMRATPTQFDAVLETQRPAFEAWTGTSIVKRDELEAEFFQDTVAGRNLRNDLKWVSRYFLAFDAVTEDSDLRRHYVDQAVRLRALLQPGEPTLEQILLDQGAQPDEVARFQRSLTQHPLTESAQSRHERAGANIRRLNFYQEKMRMMGFLSLNAAPAPSLAAAPEPEIAPVQATLFPAPTPAIQPPTRAEIEDLLKLHLDDFLKLDRRLQTASVQEEMSPTIRDARREEEAGRIHSLAASYHIGSEELKAFYKAAGAEPGEMSRFEFALASAIAQKGVPAPVSTQFPTVQEAALRYLQFEQALASKREQHLGDLLQGHSLSRKTLVDAIDAERPAFPAHREEYAARIDRGDAPLTATWAARRHLLKEVSQNEERVEEASRILVEILDPAGHTSEDLEAALQQENATPAQQDHLHEALVTAQVRLAQTRQVQAMPDHGPMPYGVSAPQNAHIEKLLAERIDKLMRLDTRIEFDREETFQREVREQKLTAYEYRATLLQERRAFDDKKRDWEGLQKEWDKERQHDLETTYGEGFASYPELKRKWIARENLKREFQSSTSHERENQLRGLVKFQDFFRVPQPILEKVLDEKGAVPAVQMRILSGMKEARETPAIVTAVRQQPATAFAAKSADQLSLPSPAKDPAAELEEYRLELSNQRLANEHWNLRKKLTLEELRFQHGFADWARSQYTSAQAEPLTPAQQAAKAEVDADMAKIREEALDAAASDFAHPDVFSRRMRVLHGAPFRRPARPQDSGHEKEGLTQ
ncbi:MAG: hypothetical protein PW734_01095 [Verrucomicrobium sp.]|nr:hypothetical protein [Verrucomicrobium sp.]